MSDESSLSKKDFKKQSTALSEALLDAQFELRKAGKGPVLVLISGNDFAGKAEVIHRFYEWLDNRFLATRAFALPKGLERRMPHLWRYWRSLPAAGNIGFYLGSWYHQPLIRLSRGEISSTRFTEQMQEIVRFERLLTDEGITLIKLWLHLTDDNAQPQAKQALARQSVSMREWGDFSAAAYEQVRDAARLMSEQTSTANAPWIRVVSHDPLSRDIRIGQIVLQATQQLLDSKPHTRRSSQWNQSNAAYLARLDYSLELDKRRYKEQLAHYQSLLQELVQHPRFAKRGLLLVFEGTDAAGKGGTIRRITQCLDPRYMRVHGTRAPSEEEKRQPYLLRFWKRVPTPGTVVIFDRSYYGRVLVERVEGFCSEYDWQRAYEEINDFEAQLRAAGTLVVKFWLAITREEQLRRFQAREESPVKRYKLTDEDWRNRKQWPAYEQAMNDMVERTSTPHAPWHVIPTEDKRHGRIETLRILCEALQKFLK